MNAILRLTLVLFCWSAILSCKKEETPPMQMPPLPFSCELSDNHKSIVAQLNAEGAIQLAAASPSIEDPALDSMIEFLGSAKIVGMGEATHGTKEFFQMKDKIFRQLVTKKGFKAIVFEIPWGNAWVVNQYVTQGIGNLNSAVNQTFYWVYDTQEVRDLAQWMREYNQTVAPEDMIHFLGNDPQGPGFQIETTLIRDYLNIVQPDTTDMLIANYAQLPSGDLFNYVGTSVAIHQVNMEGANIVYDFLEANRDDFINQTTRFEFEVILMAADLIRARELMYWEGGFGVSRDQLMAKYTEWWQNILGDGQGDTQIAAWAHNNHVANSTGWMGQFLRDNYQEDYKIVGFSFSRGGFNAFITDVNGAFESGVTNQSITDPTCPSANHLLSELDGQQHYLILDQLTGAASTYFNGNQPFTQCGAGFNEAFQESFTYSHNLGFRYNVLIHFDRTTASELR